MYLIYTFVVSLQIIHNTTVYQICVIAVVWLSVQFDERSTDRLCVLECGPDKMCHIDTCCADTKNKRTDRQRRSDIGDNGGLRYLSNRMSSQQPDDMSDTGHDLQFTVVTTA